MEKHTIDNDINVLAVEAVSFPDGISSAFDKLSALTGDMRSRQVFGISHGSENGIVYYAAASENFEDEAEQLGCIPLTVPAGVYAVKKVDNWKEKLASVGLIFADLMQEQDFDHVTPCIEWYKSPQELLCMVKLKTPSL